MFLGYLKADYLSRVVVSNLLALDHFRKQNNPKELTLTAFCDPTLGPRHGKCQDLFFFHSVGIIKAGERRRAKRGKRKEDHSHLFFVSFISQLLPSYACWCAPLPCSGAKRQVNFTASYPSWQRWWQQGGNSARCSQAAVGICPTAKSLSKQFSVFSFP